VTRIGELIVDSARRRTALSARMDEISRLVDSERRRLGELDQERIGIEGRLGELESEGKVNDGEIAQAEDECRAKESYRVGQLREVDTLKGDIRSQDGIVEADAEALSAARSRLEAVEERIDRRENLTGPATLVKEASRDEDGKEGLHALSESITFREGYEAAAAAVLESVLEALVVDGHDEVLTWHHFLETLGKKGAGFVPRTHAGGRLVPSLPELDGASRLRDHVDARAGDREVVDRLLAGVYVVDDIETALSLHRRIRGGAVFVTRDGTVVGHGGEVTVHDGTRDASASLSSEADTLRKRVRELEHRHEASQAKRTATRESIVSSTHAAEEAVGLIHEIEKKLLTLKARQRRHADETERLTERLAAVTEESETIKARSAALDEEMEFSREAEAQLSGEGSGLDVRGAEAKAGAEELRQSTEAQAADLSAWEMVVQGHASERTRVENRLQELLQGLAEAEAGMQRASFELESNHRQQGRALGEMFRNSEEREARLLKASVLKTDVTEAKEKYEDLRLEIQEAEAKVRELRKQIDALGKKLSERDREIVQINADIGLLRERVTERTKLVLEEAIADFHNRRPPTEKTLERRDELRHLLDRMGHVNILAIQEYEDTLARHEDLTSQRDDTQQALDALQKAISKLNRECRKRFREAFVVINERFQEIFPTLFEGGKARLELTDESDLLETGVEIFAQPPGKKLGNLSVMSGGEKALTAVALIFAMFKYRPSPFCLLDEVDAPLDDVNVGRVMDMLRTMTDRSQFILVTHSKITMEQADVLYGVTMEEPGITKLISMRLSQARRFAKPEADESAA
jgi:chromosome segregation protein